MNMNIRSKQNENRADITSKIGRKFMIYFVMEISFPFFLSRKDITFPKNELQCKE